MPLRVIGYDGAEYRSELNGKDRYPVVTMVLYFGYKKHWDKPTNLLGCFDVPEVFKPYVKDYAINLFEIAYLTEEKVKQFKSDFKIVADYFTQMQRNGDYKPEPVKMDHVQEVLQLLSVMTGDHRYEDAYGSEAEGRPKTMCEVLDRIENRGIQEGIQQGIQQGEMIILTLMQKLFAAGRGADAERATKDAAFCQQLLKEYGLSENGNMKREVID